MRALPKPFRLVVYYRDIEGLAYREIAALMMIPHGTVVSRLHRGCKQLPSLLGVPGPAASQMTDWCCARRSLWPGALPSPRGGERFGYISP
jgi:hypothetical protein